MLVRSDHKLWLELFTNFTHLGKVPSLTATSAPSAPSIIASQALSYCIFEETLFFFKVPCLCIHARHSLVDDKLDTSDTYI